MPSVSVKVSQDGSPPVTAHELIERLWGRCAPLIWHIEYVEVNTYDRDPRGQDKIDALMAQGRGVSGEALIDCLREIGQLIDAEFVGVEPTGAPVLRVSVVDGCTVDIQSEEEALLRRVEARYQGTRRSSDGE